jgi:hypothetical protein
MGTKFFHLLKPKKRRAAVRRSEDWRAGWEEASIDLRNSPSLLQRTIPSLRKMLKNAGASGEYAKGYVHKIRVARIARDLRIAEARSASRR